VEDLHWVDTSTEEFLGVLMDSVAAVPLMLLLTYRVGYTPPFGNRSFHTTLTLHSLSEAESLVMAGRVLASEHFPEELKATLMAKAEGVPLFIEEVTKSLLELGVLRREHGGYRMVKGVAQMRIPDTIQGIIMARLDRLGEDGKRTVQIASVIGRQFLVRLLERVAGVNHRLEELLRELKALEIIYEQGFLAEPAYIFKHAVIQDVAYNSLLVQRRKALHQAVGHAIEELYQDRLEEHYAELAHHFSQGEMWDKAVAYYWQAGAKAFARSALREAMACFEQALVAVGHLPESQERREQAIDLRLAMRNALIALGAFGAMFDHLCEAERLAASLDDPRRLGWVSAYLSVYFSNTGDQDRAVETGQRALAIAMTSEDFALEVMATFFLGLPYLSLGDYRQAVHYHRKNVETLTGEWLHERFGEPGLPAVFSRAFLDWGLAELGEFAEGIVRGEEAVQIAERTVDQPFTLSHAYLGVGLLRLRKGDLPQAIAVLERSLGVCQAGDAQFLLPWVASSLGYAYALSGRLAEALPLLEQAVEHCAATKQMSRYPLFVAHLGEAYLLAGRIADASHQAQHALERSRDLKQRGHEAYALRLLGEIAAQRQPLDVEAAAAAYRQAMTLADELGMRPLMAHCHLSLGTLYSKEGQMVQAHAELTNAIELFRAMEMTFWRPRAEAELAEVG
jgi:tetratricopeptide (TPR) repeat protein